MKKQELEIRINTTNTQRLDLTVVMDTDTPSFTNWLRGLDSVESVELRILGGLVWTVI